MRNVITTLLLSGLLATALIAGEGKKESCPAEASLRSAEAKAEGMACCTKDKADLTAEAKAEKANCCEAHAEKVASAEKDGKQMDVACPACAAKKS